MPKRACRVEIRPAAPEDMAGIRGLIRLFPRQLVQHNLPRASSFFVAVSGDRHRAGAALAESGNSPKAAAPGSVVPRVSGGFLAGCCALQIYSKRMAEVRTLAVHPDFQDLGVASRLVERCIERAKERGIRELFAVTSQTSFFARLGFATFRREKTAMFYEPASE
jgi:GNAT superfamily N-acetyltransferase